MRGRSRGCTHRRADAAADPPPRDDRRDVLQSVDRRHWQGASGARGGRAGWADGAGSGRRRHPLQVAEPEQGAGGSRTARAGGPCALSTGDPAPADGNARADGARRLGRGSGDRPGWPADRRSVRGWLKSSLRCGGTDDRNVSARRDPYRRAAVCRGAGRGGALDWLGTDAGAAGAATGPAEDRHAAAAGSSDASIGTGWMPTLATRCRSRSAR